MRTILLIFFLTLLSCDAIHNLPNDSDTTGNESFALVENVSTPLAMPMSLAKDPNSEFYFVALKGQGVTTYKRINGLSKKVSNIGIEKFNNLHTMDMVKEGDYLYVALGDFFRPKSKYGAAIIDISNPEVPKVTDVWVSKVEKKGSAVIRVQGNHVFLGAMTEGVLTFKLSEKKTLTLLSTYQPDIHFPISNPNSVQHPNARGMALEGDIMFLCNDAGGIRTIDISNKKDLKEIGRYINTSKNMKQQAYNNVVVDGNYAYAATDYCGMEVIDISDPKNMKLVGWWNPWNCDTTQNNWFNSDGHSNQIVLNAQKKRIYISTGKSELNIINVNSPTNPESILNYGIVENKKATWGLHVSNDDIYLLYITSVIPFQANWAGVKILKEK